MTQLSRRSILRLFAAIAGIVLGAGSQVQSDNQDTVAPVAPATTPTPTATPGDDPDTGGGTTWWPSWVPGGEIVTYGTGFIDGDWDIDGTADVDGTIRVT